MGKPAQKGVGEVRQTDKTGKKIAAWKNRINKGIYYDYHDKEISDSAKAAFRRAAYQTERKGREDGEKDG